DGAATGGGVAGEGAAAHRQRPDVVDGGTEVGGEGAAAHRRRRATLVNQAAAVEAGVAGENALSDRHRSEVVDAAAALVPGNGQAGDRPCPAGFDLEDPGEIAAADGQLVGPWAVDLHVVGDVELAAAQGDRAGKTVVEDDDVGAGVGVGRSDGVAE